MSLCLKVKMITGMEHTVKAEGHITVMELKKLIAQKTGVQAYLQRLATKDGELLLNRKLLSQHKLKTGDVLLLLVEQDQSMDILVRKDVHANSYHIQLSQTVAELKKMVQEKERVSVNQFWLQFEGKPMDDNDHLGDYDLSPLCTIQMNLRLRGGGGGKGY
ncbi:ubiquitin-like protein ISG15 [Phascolarctos cinereus]|uniref:Ubiquitin-like protein ISG15 n=1 Tax=Phascolarctos cinereus TaxID=38626 RepID=A0A6P5JML4_PHACI|nr:ubiquitin-like protein ISG15 [Phascolarctos cinereus]XP_020832425.1 ubiquitin-like protein ISG15 [Phascolarctos cinereus]